jgi:hypothetical protein
MSETAAAPARYLFAVARGIGDDVLADTPGLRVAPVELVTHRDLQAVVCAVDLEDFGEDALRRNLEDMAWVEEVARAHNDVVFAAATHATVAPMRLVTIFADDESVSRHLAGSYDALSAALDRVEGRREWSVKAYAARPAAPAEAATAGAGSSGSGAAYLQRKREQATRRRAAGERSIQLAEELHESIGRLTTAGRRLTPQDPRLSGRTEPMILNAAYLVTIEEGEGFRSAVQRLAEVHPDVVVEVDGPWPPYSFATLD